MVNECPCIIVRLYQYSSNIMFNHFLGELYEEVKVKDKVFSVYAVRACKGSRGIVQCHSLLTLTQMEVSAELYAPATFTLGERATIPLIQEAG